MKVCVRSACEGLGRPRLGATARPYAAGAFRAHLAFPSPPEFSWRLGKLAPQVTAGIHGPGPPPPGPGRVLRALRAKPQAQGCAIENIHLLRAGGTGPCFSGDPPESWMGRAGSYCFFCQGTSSHRLAPKPCRRARKCQPTPFTRPKPPAFLLFVSGAPRRTCTNSKDRRHENSRKMVYFRPTGVEEKNANFLLFSPSQP